MNEHEKTIRTLLPIAEASGDSRQAAYRAIAEEIDVWMKEDSTLTHAAIGKRFDKGEMWSNRLLKALHRARCEDIEFVVDWQSGPSPSSTVVPAKLSTQVEMAQQLLARPEVAEAVVRSQTPAGQTVRQI